MGGQACVLYGGSEFSRDTDIALLPEQGNLNNLETALAQLKAERIAVPELSLENLRKGHAVHFRCKHPDALNMRIDIMSVLHNASSFDTLWERRTTMKLDGDLLVDVISLPDLVAVKKTQRDKDWSHIRRLIEANYHENKEKRLPENIRFWLLETRTPEILRLLASENPDLISDLKKIRPLLELLPACTEEEMTRALTEEEMQGRKSDKSYWKPLLEELENIRHKR